ncbi:hypothetical protein [Actinacidiphila yeochonensis]|uniref:hypothetical protein n=1 Tax=Actinacidiphila yeochonensis TaxID=89050 RepID=UPI00055BE59B|nr:hypothetical protein [Actinacidiphila yeochonensis]
MMRTLTRGALAGAAGTTALNAASYADMALRGRPTSSTPEQTTALLAEKAGVDIPGDGADRESRLTGLAALNGIGVGVCVGVGVGLTSAVLRHVGLRLPRWAGAVATGALAMAAADIPIARLGVSDPHTWSATDWLSDAVPHLVYGLVTYGALTTGRDRA